MIVLSLKTWAQDRPTPPQHRLYVICKINVAAMYVIHQMQYKNIAFMRLHLREPAFIVSRGMPRGFSDHGLKNVGKQ